MLFAKYYLITMNFRSVLLLLHMHTEISCFDVKSSIFNNASNASFGKERQVKPHTSLYSTKDLLPPNPSKIFKRASNLQQFKVRPFSDNRGQNSLGQMFFALKEAFPVCKLLPFTANAPSPHCNVGC